MKIKTQTDVWIRWAIRRDMDAIVSIEKHSFEFAWSLDDFLKFLKQRNCICMVAERGEEIVGYMVYMLDKDVFRLVNFAVHPAYRHQNVGQQMIDKLIGKLSQQRRTRIALEVRESNLGAQLFFRSCGFECTGILKQWYIESGEDAYEFEFVLSGFGETNFTSRNRISGYID